MSVKESLALITARVAAAYEAAEPAIRHVKPPRLVAVSKTKPKEAVMEAYNAGQRVFGENYIQELVEKSKDAELQTACPDIRWHFIGNCQANKVKLLLSAVNLDMVETVTSAKLATKLNNQVEATARLGVFVQVNTSGEASKSGVEPAALPALVTLMLDTCPRLHFRGLMTIGNIGNSIAAATAEGGNPDFLALVAARCALCKAEPRLKESTLELSMGMSNDFEEAIRAGSSNVRVGSSIFGARSYPTKPNHDPEMKTTTEMHDIEKKLEAL